MRPSNLVLLLGACAIALVLLVPSTAGAVNIEPRRDEWKAVASLTNRAAYNGGIWTGWILMEEYSDVCFEILQDYTGNTGVTMTCEGTDNKDDTAGTAADIPSLEIAGGTATSVKLTFSHKTGTADAKWVWCVDDVPYQYLNCLFDDKAGDDANDDLTVRYSRQSP